MRIISFSSVAFLWLTACAGPMLTENTINLGTTVGTLEEKQVLQNLARFMNNPWAVPGHVELSNGQIQVTNQLGVNLKFPYSKVLGPTGAVTSKTLGYEADVNPAQTQDQESYNLLPVTDSYDLRRLRAIYHHALCPGDSSEFKTEWAIAAQSGFSPPAKPLSPATATPPKKKKTLQEAIEPIIADFLENKKSKEEVLADTRALLTTPVSDAQSEQILMTLDPKAGQKEITASIIKILGDDAKLRVSYAAPAGAKPAGGKSDTAKSTSGTDSAAFEQYNGELILSQYGLGSEPWLYTRDLSGKFLSVCADEPTNLPSGAKELLFLGNYGGHEFWTDNPKKFSDLVLFVLGNIPNTVGPHVLDNGAQSKASQLQFFTLGGQIGAVVPSKATAH